MNDTATYAIPLSYDLTQYSSYVAIACIGVFILFLIIARLLVTVETQQSDLVLFNKSQPKQLLLLVSKQLYNTTAAANNVASAIANGLMEPPPNYDMSKINTSALKVISNLGDMSTKFNSNMTSMSSIVTDNNKSSYQDSFDMIEPVKPTNKRSKW